MNCHCAAHRHLPPDQPTCRSCGSPYHQALTSAATAADGIITTARCMSCGALNTFRPAPPLPAPASPAGEAPTGPTAPASPYRAGAVPVVCCEDCGRYLAHEPSDGWGNCPWLKMPVPARALRCQRGFVKGES